MIEPLRSQYLAALGIENYAPRFILPGAKLSAACQWLDVPAALPVDPVPVPMVESVVKPTVKPIVKRDGPVSETSNSPINRAAKNSEIGPEFALSVVLAAGGLLLIDDAPASNAERSGYEKLLGNMLPALRPAAAQYALDIFLWPLTRQSKIARDGDAAKETLAAHLHKQIRQHAIDTVLLLGAAAQQWCVLAQTDVSIVTSGSLLACLRDPSRKRPLWNDLRHLVAS